MQRAFVFLLAFAETGIRYSSPFLIHAFRHWTAQRLVLLRLLLLPPPKRIGTRSDYANFSPLSDASVLGHWQARDLLVLPPYANSDRAAEAAVPFRLLSICFPPPEMISFKKGGISRFFGG